MTLITKPDFTYVWASGGAVVAPNDTKKQLGWVAEAPPFQYDNWLQNRQDQMLAHINQRGIPAWDGLTNYEAGGLSYVQGSDGVIYKSVSASGPSTATQNPTTDVSGTYWTRAFLTEDSLQEKFQLSGPQTGATNTRASISSASVSANFTADSVVVLTSLSGQPYRLSSFSKTINLATTGAGGMDVGTAPISGFVAVYAIYNPTTSTSALLGVNATAAAVAEVYDGANMPAGYTASALLSVLPTNASSQFSVSLVEGRKVSILPGLAVSQASNNATYTACSLAAYVPRNAKKTGGYVIHAGNSAGSLLTSLLSGATTGVGEKTFSVTNSLANGGYNMSFDDLSILSAQTSYYRNTSSIAGQAFSIFISSYYI